AGFIGSPSMNFFVGCVEKGRLRVPAFNNALISVNAKLPKAGTHVKVGLRPQDLGVKIDKKSDVTIEIRERLGGVSYDYLRASTGERLVVEVKGNDAVDSGTKVSVQYDKQNIYLFDAKTTLRIR
ncbi:MAG: ABC transporter ATP-binding protein, partial [Nitratireductor sp.]